MREIIKFYKQLKKFKKIFPTKKQLRKNIILVEYWKYYPSLLAFAHFFNVLQPKYNAEIVCYQPDHGNFKKRFLNYLSFNYFLIGFVYRYLGVSQILLGKIIFQEKIYTKAYEKIIKKIKNKKDILKITILNVGVGQLIYDEYLRKYNVTEVDISSSSFKESLKELIKVVYFWDNYFKKNSIKSLIISHNVYFMGIAPLVALKYKIPVYNVGAQSFNLLNKKNPKKYSCTKKFPNAFKKIKGNKKKYINMSKKILNGRFEGNLDQKLLQDQKTETVLFSKRKKKKNILRKSNNLKILVAAHCFTDAIHTFGKNLFTDMHDWIDFLGRVSHQKNYDMYIKVHPAEYDKNYNHFRSFQQKYKNLIILPKNTSVSDLLKEKIDFVLTVYGSVGHEYPLFGIPVINGSINGPHFSYNFNVNPKTKKEYIKIINNLNKFNYSITNLMKNKIYEYYFMRFMSEYALVDGWIDAMKTLKKNYNSIQIVNYFLDNFDEKKYQIKIKDLNKFIQKKSIKLVADNSQQSSKLIGYIK